MKSLVKTVWLIATLIISCFGSHLVNAAQITTIYEIKESFSPNTLIVSVTRDNTSSDTQLILRGALRGIAEQVQNMVCDGKPVKKIQQGTWSVPANCQNIQWEVPLLKNGDELASAQQSIRSGDFIIFSEASSLPRLKDATSEIIKISIPNIKTIFPNPSSTGEVTLANLNSAPIFLMLNPAIAGTEISNTVKLTYLIDNAAAISKLPAMSIHMKGLKWLNNILHVKTKENFTVAWLGISTKKISLAGAAGNGVLLTNYPDDGELPFGQAMLLYVALHEAFHQFAMNYSEQPTWVSESLAGYYGIRALQVALPNDPNTSALLERFLANGEQFKDGLVTINRQAQEGNQSEYGAFYTKGIAFWMAVDNALKQEQNDNLDHHLLSVLQAEYDVHGEPIDLQKILGLSPEAWEILHHRFLD